MGYQMGYGYGAAHRRAWPVRPAWVRPGARLELDFMGQRYFAGGRARSLASISGWNFRRASAATYLRGGELVGVADDVARVDAHGLLVEDQARNLLFDSGLSGASWIRGWMPDFSPVTWKGLSASTFDSDENYLGYAIYNVTHSVWSTPRTAYEVTTDHRQSITFTAPSGCNSVWFYPLRNSAETRYVKTTISVVPGESYCASWYVDRQAERYYVGGVQVETGLSATSLIPAMGAQVTRLADQAQITTQRDLTAVMVGDAVQTLSSIDGVVSLPPGRYSRIWG